VADIKHLGTTVTAKSEHITCGKNLLPFNSKTYTFLSLSKDLKIKIHKDYKTRGHTQITQEHGTADKNTGT